MQEKRIKQQLLEFLDNKAFDPILEATPEQYSSERDKRMLEDVKRDVAVEKEKFHEKEMNPEQIRESYIRHIYFEKNSRLGKELEDLELPRLVQLKDKFLQLCKELDI